MSMQMLMLFIGAYCEFRNPQVSTDYKDQCLHFVANCAIIQDGKTTEKQANKCLEKWHEKRVSKR